MPKTTCKFCLTPNLEWRQVGVTWRQFDDADAMHECDEMVEFKRRVDAGESKWLVGSDIRARRDAL